MDTADHRSTSIVPGANMTLSQIWQTAMVRFRKRFSANVLENFFGMAALRDLTDDEAVIEAPNPFAVNTMQSRFASEIENALSEIVGRRVRVSFAVANSTHEIARTQPPRQRTVPEKPAIVNHQRELTPSIGNLQPNLTFETYVVGSSNRMAHAAAGAIAEHPGKQYNPFFVHGGVGLGKTHLMHAIGHRALEIAPDTRVLYVTSETFTNDVIDAIRHQRMDDFRDRYRTIDILMVDDIQFIAGKESTQEEFFHTFNALHQAGKQVIVSSDRPPREIAALEERMRSRFAGGLVTDVQQPDFEMRTAILGAKAEERNVHIGTDVLEYIARRDQTNIRELEGALTRLLMFAQIYKLPITLHVAMEALSDGKIRANKQTTAGDVIRAVCDRYGLEEKELLGKSRSHQIAFPRQVAMYLMRKDADISLEEIGKVVGRDHTTVMHGVRKIEEKQALDATLRTDIMSIRERLLRTE